MLSHTAAAAIIAHGLATTPTPFSGPSGGGSVFAPSPAPPYQGHPAISHSNQLALPAPPSLSALNAASAVAAGDVSSRPPAYIPGPPPTISSNAAAAAAARLAKDDETEDEENGTSAADIERLVSEINTQQAIQMMH